jgi:hypothetical protein
MVMANEGWERANGDVKKRGLCKKDVKKRFYKRTTGRMAEICGVGIYILF